MDKIIFKGKEYNLVPVEQESNDPFAHLPKSWDDLNDIDGYNQWEDLRNSDELTIFLELIILCDEWHEGWKYDAKKGEEAFIIYYYKGEATIDVIYGEQGLLSFQTREKAQAFLDTFRDEIESAKMFLGA